MLSNAPPARAGTVTVNGAELFCKQAGEGPPLLLLHGVGPDSGSWSPTFEDLARDHRVIAYDRRGYGQSAAAPRTGGWHQHGEDAAALLRAVEAGPTTMVGWSGGGLVALHVAARHPELVTAVVLAETGLPLPPIATGSYLRTLARAKLEARLRGGRKASETFVRWALSEGGGRSTWDGYDQERRERVLANADAMWTDFEVRGRPDVSRRQLALVRCPVTLLVGDMSQPWFKKSAEALVEMLQDARIETINGANHAFNDHRPQEFADAIRRAAARGRGS